MILNQLTRRIPKARSLTFALTILVLCLSYNNSFAVQTTTKAATPVRQTQRAESQLVEEFSFAIKDLKVDHQAQLNNLNISVRYRYVANISKADYPDFRSLAKDIETLLNNYPNETDYWEIVNKQLTSMLLKKYASIASVTIEIEVSPSSLVPYSRSSTVTRARSRKTRRQA